MLTCHWTVGVGVPLAAAENETLAAPYVTVRLDGSVVIEGAVHAACTFNVPFPVAKSVADVDALTVKEVVPPGVDVVVAIVNVAVLESSLGVNETGLGENEALAPVGNVVVILKSAVKDPLEPPPVPLFTVIK
jgi:hypothetical protein